MSFKDGKSVNDLVRIAAAGGGFEIDRGFLTVDDLVRIAAAASTHQARVTVTNLGMLSINDLVRIGAAGKGSVSFKA